MSEPEKEILPAFIHWTFFETIDEDLYAYSRYLEFNPKNYGAFSINLARLYLSICSEVDVLAKMLCAKLKEPTERSSIEHYRKVITKRYSGLCSVPGSAAADVPHDPALGKLDKLERRGPSRK